MLEDSSVEGDAWVLSASWRRAPERSTPGDGPCINMWVSTGTGPSENASGGGWCDIPEGRLIGEWTSRRLGETTSIAWGPTSSGAITQVRIDFAEGSPLVVTPKPTPWSGFDYWFATFPADIRALALVALDPNGVEVAREDLSGRPPDRGPRNIPVGINEGQALEIANGELEKGWFLTAGVKDPQAHVVRLTRFPDEENQPGGAMVAPDLRKRYGGRLVWAVQVEGEARPGPDSPDRSDRVYYFHGVFIDFASGEVLARYASLSQPLLYPRVLRTAYSSECVSADPNDGLPKLHLAIAIVAAKDRLEEAPAGPGAQKADFSIADAQLISCSGPGSGAEPSLYWLVTVPAEMSLARCGPAMSSDTEIGATCWSGHTYVRVDGTTGSVSIGPHESKQGPLLSDLELDQLNRVAAAEGWWRVWAVLRSHGGARPQASFTYALAAYEAETRINPSSSIAFPLDAAAVPPTYPSLSPRDDPVNWAAQRSVALIVVGRVAERTDTFAIDRESLGVESHGLWRVEIESLVHGRLPGDETENVIVRFSDPGSISPRFPVLPPQQGTRVVLFLQPAPSMGDSARALDLEPAAMPGINGVVKVDGDIVRLWKGDATVEEHLETFIERVKAIRAGLAEERN